MDVEQQYTCDFIKQTMGLSNRFIGFLHVELKGLLDRLYLDTGVPSCKCRLLWRTSICSSGCATVSCQDVLRNTCCQCVVSVAEDMSNRILVFHPSAI
jgi:hypothetical protein